MTAPARTTVPAARGPMAEAWDIFRRSPSAMLGLLLLLVVMGMTFAGPFLYPVDPFEIVETEVLGVATAPVASFSQGAGPYGHLDLVGNVREWTAQAQGETLRVVRGGAWSSPLAAFEHSITFENRRDPRYFDFATGIRCARWEEAGPWRLD